MKKAIIIALSSVSVFAAKAETSTWIGSVGPGDWNVATNWASGIVPVGNAVAVFPCDYGQQSHKLVFRLTPAVDFTGTIVTTNDFTALAPTHPTYMTLSVLEGASWKVSGCGTVIATPGIEARISQDFTGTVDVPEGETFTIPPGFPGLVSFTGIGTLILDTPERMAQTAGFAGMIRIPSGAVVSASNTASFKAPSFLLGNGSTLAFPEKALAWGAIREIPDWNTSGAWSFNADNARLLNANSPVELDDRPPFVTAEGDLRLVNDPAQSHTAFFTNRMFRLTDDWGVSFTFIPELPDDSKFVQAGKRQEMEGYFGFYLQSVSPVNVGAPVHRPVPAGFGNAIYLYRGGMPHMGWHFNADAAMAMNQSVFEKNLDGILFNRPIDYDVICMDGVLTVTISQNGKSFSMRKSLRDGYLNSRPQGVYIGFGGACSWWNADSYPWTRMTVRGFKGWYRAREAGAWNDISGSFYPFSADNWVLSHYNITDKKVETAQINDEGSFDLIPYEYQKAATASCKLPLSAESRYLVDVDVKWPRANKGLCEGITLAVGKRKPVAGNYIFEHTSGWQFDQWAYSLGLKHNLYGNGFFTPYMDFVHSENGTNVRCQESLQHTAFLPVASGQGMRYSFGYDPSGEMRWTFSRAPLSGNSNSGTLAELCHNFDPESMEKFRARKGDGAANAQDMFLLMCGASANWGALETVVHGVTVRELADNNSPKVGRISVDAGAKATLLADATFPNSDTPALKLSRVDLHGGSSLTVSTKGPSARVHADEIRVNASASVSSDEGVTVVCSRFTYAAAGSVIKLSGAVDFGDALTFVVPDAYRREAGEKLLLDASAANVGEMLPERVTVLDENGADRTSSCLVLVRNGRISIASRGLIMVIK